MCQIPRESLLTVSGSSASFNTKNYMNNDHLNGLKKAPEGSGNFSPCPRL